MQFLDKLKEFWVLISTPGTQMPMKTTVITMIVIVAFTFLVPQLVQWRYYRRNNPTQSPKEAAKAKANAITGGASKSAPKKKNKKKKKR